MSPNTAEHYARDPNVLASLFSFAFHPQVSKDADTTRSIEETDFQRGLTTDQKTNDHTLRILDSIAELLVAQPSHEAFAVALKHDPEVMNLYIAGNAPLPDTTLDHLHQLWGNLAVISDMYAESRADPKWHQWTEASPEIDPPIEIRRLQVLFLRDIYIFSWAKMDKRLRKWVPKLSNFIQDLKAATELNPDGVDKELTLLLEQSLSGIFYCEESLKRLVNLTKADPLSYEAEWDQLVSDLHDATQSAEKILKDGDQCERWAYKANTNAPIRLRRALEKCLSLPRHADILLRFANSPRLRPIFKKKLLVHGVKPQVTAVSWPPTLDAWQSVHNQITTARPASDVVKKIPKMPLTPITHCECTLIAHFHNNFTTEQAPFSYIGLTKLSCKACYAFISAYNKLSERPKFHTKGCHDKWYPGWCMPLFSDIETNERMESDVANEIIDMYRSFAAKQKGLSTSDSTDASTGSSFGKEKLSSRPVNKRVQIFPRTP